MDLILEASFFYSKYFHNQSKVYLMPLMSIKEDDMDQIIHWLVGMSQFGTDEVHTWCRLEASLSLRLSTECR